MNNTAAFKVDTKGLDDTIKRALDATHKSLIDLCTQAAHFFVQSIIKLTKPGTGNSIKGLADKYKWRPVEKKNRTGKNFYVYYSNQAAGPQLWETDADLSHNDQMVHKVKKVDQFIKYWSKSESRWMQWPWVEGLTNQKKLRIPYAARAKAAWLGVYRLLGKPCEGDTTFSRMKKRIDRLKVGIFMANDIRYASEALAHKSAMQTAVNNAEARLRHSHFSKAESDIIKAARG